MLPSPVLLLLLSRAAAALVPPPTNVTLSCQNLHVAVRWEYSEQRPQTRFRVRLIGSEGRYEERETPDHQYDLSDFVWESEESYMDLHYVTVTTVEGGNQSEPVSSKTFSFNDLKTVGIKCELDFPHVDVDAKDSGATVSFNNPLHYYSRLQLAAPPRAEFKFTVKVSSSGHFDEFCKKEQEKCKLNISFPEGGEECVRLEGRLFDENSVSSVVFRQTGDICATHSTELSMTIVLAVVLSVIVFIVTTVIIILICKARAWTLKPALLPSSLMDFDAAANPRDGDHGPVSRTHYSLLTVVPAEPCKTTSVSSGDGDSLTEDRLTEYSSCCSEGDLGEGYGGGGLEEEEEEEEPSPYDRQHNLQVDMGDGDMATGYS